MSKMTKKCEKVINSLPEHLQEFKLKYDEETAIMKKKKLYQNVEWTSSQKAEFDSYWVKYYGKKIRPCWHKLYQSLNGTYRFDYFPEMLYTTKLEPMMNPSYYKAFLGDKSFLKQHYGLVPEIRIPNDYVVCCNGVFRDSKQDLITKEEAVGILSNVGECVIKPTIDSGSGREVVFFNIENGVDSLSGEKAENIIQRYGKDFVAQEVIKAGRTFSTLYPYAINTIRHTTYIVNSEIHHTPISIRIGSGGSHLDNIHSGGIGVQILEDGTLKAIGYQLGYGNQNKVFYAHPDTGVKFDGYFLCDIQKLIELAKKLHALTPQVGIISWDFTVDENGHFVLIEANCSNQGVWFPQIISGDSLFGKDTPYMLSLIRK